jgi:hypothetical protein
MEVEQRLPLTSAGSQGGVCFSKQAAFFICLGFPHGDSVRELFEIALFISGAICRSDTV